MMDVICSNSKLHGKGVFANKGFQKGETVMNYTGDLYNMDEHTNIVNDELSGEDDRYIQVNEKYFLGPFKDKKKIISRIDQVDNYINHSCNPSCYIQSNGNYGLKVIAAKYLQKGTEITIDYSTTILFDTWTMKCRCGSKKCRKVIGDFRFIPTDVQKCYFKNNALPKFIREYYKASCPIKIK